MEIESKSHRSEVKLPQLILNRKKICLILLNKKRDKKKNLYWNQRGMEKYDYNIQLTSNQVCVTSNLIFLKVKDPDLI